MIRTPKDFLVLSLAFLVTAAVVVTGVVMGT
jgi:hypothetical protein